MEALIGHSGGFSNVYRAILIDDAGEPQDQRQRVAIKVLKGGSILKLQREVDVLSKFDHPNIVRLTTQGQTEDGRAYLVMEYLEGGSLRDRCQRTLRLSTEELKNVSIKLLDAIVHIHPNEDKAEKLRQKAELTPNEFAEIERARHGKIHRDIKPENIIFSEKRGPILIDFNISVNARDEVMTVSHTPGYLPDDLNIGQWTPDVDLYQLGLTLAQAATGINYDFSGSRNVEALEDIRMYVQNDLPEKLAEGILKLFAKTRESRFSSASQALKFFRNT
ncbi:MAG TPA: serine/threonine-protein kinase [Elainellaceae cyanobacterium]